MTTDLPGAGGAPGPAVIVDPYSSGMYFAPAFREAGVRTVAVLSRPEVMPVYAPSWRPEDFDEIIRYDGAREPVVARLRELAPSCVVAGADPGVELADLLAARLLPATANVPDLAAARRDKGAMAAVVAAAGLPTLAQICTADPEEARAWIARAGLTGRDLVIKPPRSASTDGVERLPRGEGWREAFEKQLGSPNQWDVINDRMLLMEYATGTEYVVDTFSHHGRHTVADVTRYSKVDNGPHMAVYSTMEWLAPGDPVVAELTDYTRGVLDAVGMRFGAAHVEIMWTADGPRLIELNARPHGGGHPRSTATPPATARSTGPSAACSAAPARGYPTASTCTGTRGWCSSSTAPPERSPTPRSSTPSRTCRRSTTPPSTSATASAWASPRTCCRPSRWASWSSPTKTPSRSRPTAGRYGAWRNASGWTPSDGPAPHDAAPHHTAPRDNAPHGTERSGTMSHDAPAVRHPDGAYHEANGHRLWVESEGQGDPVLLLAGLGPAGSHVVFHPHFDALASDHRVLYVDLHGRGRSDTPDDLTELTFARDVADIAALLTTLDLGPVHLYGFSYGGLLGQALALDHPETVRTLTLANSLHSPQMWQLNHENINRELELQFPEVWARITALRERGVPSTDPAMQAEFAAAVKPVRFHNPDHASLLATEPGARNLALYPSSAAPTSTSPSAAKSPASPTSGRGWRRSRRP